MKLQDLKVGQRARLKSYESGEKVYRQKCLSMGLTPGVEIRVLSIAPLGCPIEIEVRGYCLSLRAKEAQMLTCVLIETQAGVLDCEY